MMTKWNAKRMEIPVHTLNELIRYITRQDELHEHSVLKNGWLTPYVYSTTTAHCLFKEVHCTCAHGKISKWYLK